MDVYGGMDGKTEIQEGKIARNIIKRGKSVVDNGNFERDQKHLLRKVELEKVDLLN